MHTHTWRVTAHYLLEPPDRFQHARRTTLWQCLQCLAVGEVLAYVGTGYEPLGKPLGTPETVRAEAVAEQQTGTPEAQQARLEHSYRWT